MSIKALKVNSDTYHIYSNLIQAGGQTPTPLAGMNNRFIILRTTARPLMIETRLEVWDEVDFRSTFKWVSGASVSGFTEVVEIERDVNDDTKWQPSLGDLGAV